MGYVEGGSLAAAIEKGPRSPDAAAALVKEVCQAVAYAAKHIVAGFFVCALDRKTKRETVGRTVALDDNAVQSEENAAIGFVGVQLVAQQLEGGSGKQITDPGAPRSRQRGAQEFADLPRRALGNLDGDVAAEALGDDDIGRTLADAVALDKADEFHLRQIELAQ